MNNTTSNNDKDESFTKRFAAFAAACIDEFEGYHRMLPFGFSGSESIEEIFSRNQYNQEANLNYSLDANLFKFASIILSNEITHSDFPNDVIPREKDTGVLFLFKSDFLINNVKKWKIFTLRTFEEYLQYSLRTNNIKIFNKDQINFLFGFSSSFFSFNYNMLENSIVLIEDNAIDKNDENEISKFDPYYYYHKNNHYGDAILKDDIFSIRLPNELSSREFKIGKYTTEESPLIFIRNLGTESKRILSFGAQENINSSSNNNDLFSFLDDIF